MTSGASITKTFNAGLFLFVSYGTLVSYLFTPDDPGQVPWESLLKGSASPIPMAGVLFLIATYVLWGGWIFRRIWNGFIANVFDVRAISFDEAITIVLLMAALRVS